MLALVTVVCFTAVKNKITAKVLRMPRQITNFLLLGLRDDFDFFNRVKAKIIPKRNRKKVISIAGISELLVINLAKTVADAKHSSASKSIIIPLYIITLKLV